MEIEDLSRWEFWWEFNREPFIQLKASVYHDTITDSAEFYMGSGVRRNAVDVLAPSEAQITGTILPRLAHALESTNQRDIVSSCMIAMAKIGRSTDEIDILAAFRQRLTEKDQEVRETAAIALGISQRDEALPTLIDLALDTPAGRKLCDRDHVDYRTRAFAIYGLGLEAWSTADHAIKAQAFGTLRSILEADQAPERDIRVAVINAIGILAPDPAHGEGKTLLLAAVDTLHSFWKRDLGITDALIQAHVPPAIGKLLRRIDRDDPELSARLAACQEDWMVDLAGKGLRRAHIDACAQSDLIALGCTCLPVQSRADPSTLESRIVRALSDHAVTGQDAQSRYFALMALGRAGGEVPRDFLLDRLRKGQKALERPWAALALGVSCFHAREREGAAAVADALVGSQILLQLESVKNPSSQAAFAIALGLCSYTEAGPALLQLLDRQKNQDDLAGYICIGLALMKFDAALGPIQDLVVSSTRRPERLRQAATALGKLGDRSAAMTLVGLLADCESDGIPDLSRMSAISSALGFIGDGRTIDPLVSLLDNTRLTSLGRAFAAVALGGIADKELLRWNSKLSVDMNYRAAVETLTNSAAGVLDIL